MVTGRKLKKEGFLGIGEFMKLKQRESKKRAQPIEIGKGTPADDGERTNEKHETTAEREEVHDDQEGDKDEAGDENVSPIAVDHEVS